MPYQIRCQALHCHNQKQMLASFSADNLPWNLHQLRIFEDCLSILQLLMFLVRSDNESLFISTRVYESCMGVAISDTRKLHLNIVTCTPLKQRVQKKDKLYAKSNKNGLRIPLNVPLNKRLLKTRVEASHKRLWTWETGTHSKESRLLSIDYSIVDVDKAGTSFTLTGKLQTWPRKQIHIVDLCSTTGRSFTLLNGRSPVSYTHLTLPTNREV